MGVGKIWRESDSAASAISTASASASASPSPGHFSIFLSLEAMAETGAFAARVVGRAIKAPKVKFGRWSL